MRQINLGIAVILLTACFSLLSGCITIKAGSPTSASQASNEPVLGEWAMVRSGIEPGIPVPDMLVNQVVTQQSTWKFQRSSGKLTLRCDGSDTWYKIPLGVSVNKKETTVSEGSGKYVFNGGGSIDLSGISAIITGIMGQKIEQASAEFSDANSVSLTQGNNGINAVITVNASGKYYGEMETGGMKWKSINQKLTIKYSGTRK